MTPSSGSRRRVFIPENGDSMFHRNVTIVVIINYENYKIVCDLSTFSNKSFYKYHKPRYSAVLVRVG